MIKNWLRILFLPVLNLFESGSGSFDYKPLNRAILVILGSLFVGLAMLVTLFAPGEDLSYLFPVVVFGGIGVLSLVIGFLGTDRAVAKIWGSGSSRSSR